jgi:hypothetical protein
VSLARFAKDVWLLHDIELRLLFEKLVCEGRPQNKVKDFLTLTYGKWIANRILINAYDARRFAKEQDNTQEKKRAKEFIQDLDTYKKLLIKKIVKTHKKVIEKHEVVSEIIEGICFSPLFI